MEYKNITISQKTVKKKMNTEFSQKFNLYKPFVGGIIALVF